VEGGKSRGKKNLGRVGAPKEKSSGEEKKEREREREREEGREAFGQPFFIPRDHSARVRAWRARDGFALRSDEWGGDFFFSTWADCSHAGALRPFDVVGFMSGCVSHGQKTERLGLDIQNQPPYDPLP